MTVASELNRKEYAGNGVTTAFDTNPVVFFDEGDLDVYVVVDATGVATLKTITTHYTVSGGEGATGTVTMSTAPASGETLVIVRTLDVTQAADFVNNDGSDAEVAEDAVDRLTMIAQQIDAKVDRSFRLPDSDTSGASTELPTPVASTLIGWNEDGDALQNYVAGEISDEILVSTFMETVLDDASAADARSTLGVALTTKGDLLAGTGSNAVARKAAGTDGYVLRPSSGANDGLVWMPPASGYTLEGGYLDWSVSGSVLTITIKTWAGNDPSDSAPVFITFRSATAATGLPVTRKLTAATSIAVNNTATLGTSNSVPFRLWAVAFDDGGTVRLAVINCRGTAGITSLAGWGVASATQEDDSSDAAQTFYSHGAGVSSKAYAVLGYGAWESGLATAGTWSAGPTRVQLFGPGVPLPGQLTGNTVYVLDGAGASITTASFTDVTNSSLAITPSSACNAVLVSWSFDATHTNNAATNNTLARQALRDASVIAGEYASQHATGSGGGASQGAQAIGPVLDFPGSSSSVTYKLQHKTDSTSATIGTQDINAVAQEIMV